MLLHLGRLFQLPTAEFFKFFVGLAQGRVVANFSCMGEHFAAGEFEKVVELFDKPNNIRPAAIVTIWQTMSSYAVAGNPGFSSSIFALRVWPNTTSRSDSRPSRPSGPKSSLF